LVSTIPSASKGISCILTFVVVEIKVDVRLQPQTYHRKREESRDAPLLFDKLQLVVTTPS